MEQQQLGQLVQLARSLGWINDQQIAQASQSLYQAKQAGHQVRIGQALVHLGALSEAQVLQLLEQLGIVVLACAHCQRAWNAPTQTMNTARCPDDGSPLQRVASLQVVGDLPAHPVTVADSLGTEAKTLASHRNPVVTVPSPMASSQSAEKSEKYEVKKELGRGGMGAVYLARDRELEREVAMKVVLDGSADPTHARFMEEARITGQLEHPNIIPVHELGTQGLDPFFTMKFVRGQSLKALIDDHGQGRTEVSLQRYLSIFMKILDGVSFAHANKVLHRDLKPENIMLGEHGEVLVMDWGLAKAIDLEAAKNNTQGDEPRKKRIKSLREQDGEDSAWTMDGDISGTPNYMSPEQADGLTAELGPGSDIFSLGAILYEMLTLKKAFPGGAIQAINKVLKGKFEDPQKAAGGRFIPPELAAVVKKAMAPKVAQRYLSIQEFQQDIEHYMSGRAVSARKDPVFTALFKWMKRNPTLTVLALVVLPLSLFLLGYVFFRPGTVRVNVEQMPINSVIKIGGEEIVLDGQESVIERPVWPFLGAEIKAVSGFPEPFQPFGSGPEHKVSAGPDELVSVTLKPEWKKAQLVLELEGDESASVTVTRTSPLPPTIAKRPEGLPASTQIVNLLPRTGVTSEINAVPGDYQLKYSKPGYLDESRSIQVTENGQSEPIRWTPMLQLQHEFASRVLDYQFADVDLDGTLELVIAQKTHIKCFSVSSEKLDVKWSRAIESAAKAIRIGRHFSIADLDSDGQLEVVCSTTTKVLRLNAATGETLSDFDLHDPRIRVLPLDPSGAPSIIVGTGYKGVQRFNGNGERVWSCMTAKYAGFSPFLQLPMPGQDYAVVIMKTVQPFVLYAIRSDTGALLWKRALKVGDAGVFACRDKESPVVLTRTKSEVTAWKLADGSKAWTPKAENFQRILSGSFQDESDGRLLTMGGKKIHCFNAKGEELWQKNVDSVYGQGSMGDIDGDGCYEWLCPVNKVVQTKQSKSGRKSTGDVLSFEVNAYSAQGKLLKSLRVPALESSLRLGPTVVQFKRNGDRYLFITQKQSCSFYRFGQKKSVDVSKDRFLTANLDGKGRDEVLVQKRNRSLQCLGDIQWTLKRTGKERFYFNPDVTTFGDANGDGVLDLISRGFLNTKKESLFVISGKNGEVLFCQSLEENAAQAPLIGPLLSNGKACLIYLGNNQISVFQLDPQSKLEDSQRPGLKLLTVPWNKGDARAYVEDGDPPRLIFSQNGGQVCSLKLKKGGKVQQVARTGQISTRPRIVKANDEWVVAGALGTLFFISEDGKKTQLPVFKSGVSSFLKRGKELIAISEHHELAFIQLNPLKVTKRMTLQGFRETLGWVLSTRDLDGDGLEEILLHEQYGSVVILDGRNLRVLYLFVSGVTQKDLNEVIRDPARTADLDGDGKLDLLTTTGYGSRVVLDILGKITEAMDVMNPSADPLLSLAYFRREFLTYVRTQKIDRYLERLKGTAHEELARQLAFRFTGNPRYAAENSPSPTSYVKALGQLFDSQQNLAQLAKQRDLSSLGIQLDFIVQLIENSKWPDEKRRAIVRQLRLDLKNDPKAEAIWLSRLRNADFQRDFQRARDLGELMLQFYPENLNARRIYERLMINRAMTLHRSFQRTEPRLLMIRGLKYLNSPRFHVYYANFHQRRNFPNPNEALDHLNQAVKLAGSDDCYPRVQRAFYHYRMMNRLIRQKNMNRARQSLAAALKDLEVARTIEATNPAALALSGLLFLTQGQNQQGFELLDKGLKDGPQALDDSFDLAYLALFNYGDRLIRAGQARRGYEKVLAARRLTDPSQNQVQEDFQFAKRIAAVDKKLAKSILERLLGQVSDKDKPIIQKMIKQLGG